jgi:glyceraldehyde 3-phosphate dehydrogenase
MAVRIGINGFGRIGRLVCRLLANHSDIEVVAINDLVPSDNLAYLLKFDSTHGLFNALVKSDEANIYVNDKAIKVCSQKDPLNLPWKDLNVDYVVEATGFFTHLDDAKYHIQAGAKRVLISAPAKGEVPTFVMGVNHDQYNPSKDFVISNASCTTNCLAPITKVLLDSFGIEEGLMTTVHALTASQPTVDGPSKKDWRGGRGALQNVIPATTGAAQAVVLCLPQIKGKITGMAFRVPVADVSVVDLTVRLSKKTTYEAIAEEMKRASQGPMKGILGYTEDEVVSSDFISSSFSAIFDKEAGIALNDQFFKIIAWYDNEMGYANRIVDLLVYMATKERK